MYDPNFIKIRFFGIGTKHIKCGMLQPSVNKIWIIYLISVEEHLFCRQMKEPKISFQVSVLQPLKVIDL